MMATMLGHIMAICGWVVWRLQGSVPGSRLRRLGARRAVLVLAGLLAVLALVPMVVAVAQPQPQDLAVEQIRMAGGMNGGTWVRLRGRVVPLEEAPVSGAGHYALLVDEYDRLEAIVVDSDRLIGPSDATMVTGHIRYASVTVDTRKLPIEATVAGTPPKIVGNQVVDLDAAATPERLVLWPVTILGGLLVAMLFVGLRTGYPIFREAHEIDVLAQPLAPGDKMPVAVGGRIGQQSYDLADPAGALVLVGPGPRGGILTLQVLDDGPSEPAPIAIGGGWTSGRIGYVHTVDETVPALYVRSERADAVLLFARTTERDRAAALVTVER